MSGVDGRLPASQQSRVVDWTVGYYRSVVGGTLEGGWGLCKQRVKDSETTPPLRRAWDDNALWVSGVTPLAIIVVDGAASVGGVCLYIETKR